jgi:hypothetical protein
LPGRTEVPCLWIYFLNRWKDGDEFSDLLFLLLRKEIA